MLTGTNTITRAAEPQAYYHVFGISTGSDLSITGSDETAKLIISGSDAADHGSTGINAGSRLYIKNCVIHSSGHDEIEPGYTGIFAEEDLIIENSTVTAESTGVYGCGMYSYAGDIRIDEASHVTATSEADGGAVKLSDSGALYVGDAAYELDENAAKLEVKDGAVTEGAKIKAPYVNGVSMLAAANNTVSCGDGSAVYNPATNTLTLNNAEITTGHEGCGIYSGGPLTIELVGGNTVGGDGASFEVGVKIEGNLTFTGDGSLAAAGCGAQGISVSGSLTVNGGNVTGATDGGGHGISVGGDMTVTGGTVKGGCLGSDSGEEYLSSYAGIDVGGSMKVTGGEVIGTAEAAYNDGIEVKGNLTVDGGSVTGTATNGTGIRITGDLTVDSGSVSGSGGGLGGNGVFVFGGLTINDGSVIGSATDGEEKGGVYVATGGLTINDGSVIGSATDGEEKGGVYVATGGLTVNGGSVSGTVTDGEENGGVYVYIGGLTVSGGSLTGTAGGELGMGISALSGLTVTGGTVTGSATGAEGVGISVFTGMTVSGGEVTGESGGRLGLGVYVEGGLTAEGGRVTGIAPNYSGWGVYADSLALSGGAVTGESSGEDGCGICVHDAMTVSGGKLSGAAGKNGCGIKAGVITVTDGTVAGRGGSAAIVGYYEGAAAAEDIIKLPEGYLPAGYELQTVPGSGGTYAAVTPLGGTLAYDETALLFTGAAGYVTLSAPEPETPGVIIPIPEPEPEPEPEAPAFADVDEGAWYYEAVEYAAANGLMEGVSDNAFEPDAGMTRAMLWTILAHIDGEAVTGADWAETARAWAMESGVSDGTDAGGSLTREQLAAMLYRFAGEPETAASLDGFTDAASVSDWAARAMAWAVGEGIITGVTDTALDPQGSATRAQCAAMLMRFVESA